MEAINTSIKSPFSLTINAIGNYGLEVLIAESNDPEFILRVINMIQAESAKTKYELLEVGIGSGNPYANAPEED
jgi:hypothetical protein